MLDSEKEKLLNREKECLSIGITQDGTPNNFISVPWVQTSHAFNMKLPDVYLTPEDLEDSAIMEKISSFKVVGFYIWAQLSNYEFLSRFPHIRDLNIFKGEKIENLDFLYNLKECSMFFLKNAKIQNINPILDVHKTVKFAIFGGFGCVGLYNCTVEDISRFANEEHRFFEFLIWSENQKDKERWKSISSMTWKYYEIENE